MVTLADIDAEIAKRQEADDLNSAVDAEIAKRLSEKDSGGVMQEIESAFQAIPGIPALSEFASGVNRSVLGTLDFLTVDNANAILNLSGSEMRVPTAEETFGSEGGFMELGLARDIVSTAGELAPVALGTGQVIRQAAQKLPAVTAAEAQATGAVPKSLEALKTEAQATGSGLLRQAAGTTAKQDVALGAASAAGMEIGEDVGGPVGAMVGSVLAPIGAQAAVGGIKGALKLGGKAFSNWARGIEKMSDEGASELLSQAMVREGVPPELIAQRLEQLGPEALPADLGENFARLLRTASNKVPRVEGRAKDVLNQRHAGQSGRVIDAMDDASGTSLLAVDDEIARLDTLLKPQINALYEKARANPFKILDQPAITGERSGTGVPLSDPALVKSSKKLRALLTGNSSAARALQKTGQLLNDKRAMGDRVGDIDVIDATKKVMDDQINTALRLGKKEKVRSLVRIKNEMVRETDKFVPEYKEARNLYAGKAQLENAADSGMMFMKLKPREVDEFVQSMGESEKKMFKLGAKQAILDKVDDLQTTADTVKRLFGKNGDVKKLRSLFDDEDSFVRFKEVLDREAQFVMTRRAAQGNSTTVQQLSDMGTAEEHLGQAFSLLGSPAQAASAFGRILGGLSGKKGEEVFIRSLEKAGDILLTSGMDPKKVQAMVRKAAPNEIEEALRKVMIKPIVGPTTPAGLIGGTKAALGD